MAQTEMVFTKENAKTLLLDQKSVPNLVVWYLRGKVNVAALDLLSNNISPIMAVEIATVAGLWVTIDQSWASSTFVHGGETISFGNGTIESIKKKKKWTWIKELLMKVIRDLWWTLEE